MNRIMQFIAKVAVGKHLLKALAFTHDKLNGRRTEITAGLLGIVHVLKLANIIPAEQAEAIEKSLLAILPVVLADKASKAIKAVDNVAPKLPEPKP